MIDNYRPVALCVPLLHPLVVTVPHVEAARVLHGDAAGGVNLARSGAEMGQHGPVSLHVPFQHSAGLPGFVALAVRQIEIARAVRRQSLGTIEGTEIDVRAERRAAVGQQAPVPLGISASANGLVSRSCRRRSRPRKGCPRRLDAKPAG